MAAGAAGAAAARRRRSGAGGRSSSVAVGVVVWLVVMSQLTGEAGAWSLWPHWFWCFPDCLVGETCYSRVYNRCRSIPMPGRWVSKVETCFLGALDWCNADHFKDGGWPVEIIVEDQNPEDNY